MTKIEKIVIVLLLHVFLQPAVVWAADKSAKVRFSNVIEIPILVTHIIPLDHVGFDIELLGQNIGDVSVKLGLDGRYADLLSGQNSLGRGMFMREIIATGDNQNYWTPSEFDNTRNSYRARSLYIIQYNPQSKKFSVQSNDEHCYIQQQGTGHLFERGTSTAPTLPDLFSGKTAEIKDYYEPNPGAPDPAIVGLYDRYELDINSGPVPPGDVVPLNYEYVYSYYGGFTVLGSQTETRLGTGCYRQYHSLGDGACITKAATSDEFNDVPQSLFYSPAVFDDAPPADLNDFFYPKGVVNVNLEMENNLEAPFIKLDVNWEFNIKLDFRGYEEGVTPTYEVRGKHDVFPEYTVHIGDQMIYGFDGVQAGNSPLALGYPFMTDVEDVSDAGLLVPRPFSGEISLPISKKMRSVSTNPDRQCN